MDQGKLFHVLVMGGAMLGLGCGGEGPRPNDAARAPGDDAAAVPGDDAATAQTDAAAPTDDAGDLVNCGFCPNEACCEGDGAGGQRQRAGMMCCWGTSC